MILKQPVALRVLGEIMGWNDDEAEQEYAWLRLMSRLKYDGYQDYLAGARFVESLANWIQQFDPSDRTCAYRFVRESLVYIGPAEMLRLVELFFPDVVQRRLVTAAAAASGVHPHRVWGDRHSAEAYDRLLRRTLFIGLSEGARLDLFRHANAGMIRNEQVLLATYVDSEKWHDLHENLCEELKDPHARFGTIYLIDDITASGTTFIRWDSKKEKWKGKLAGFYDNIRDLLPKLFEDQVHVVVHHYLATHAAEQVLWERQAEALADLGADHWFERVEFTFGMVFPPDLPINRTEQVAAADFVDLAKQYYDPAIESTHTRVGGTDSVALGFGGCALPLILDHNTPNNSVALLWAETDGRKDASAERNAHAMRSLFRRRQRHT